MHIHGLFVLFTLSIHLPSSFQKYSHTADNYTSNVQDYPYIFPIRLTDVPHLDFWIPCLSMPFSLDILPTFNILFTLNYGSFTASCSLKKKSYFLLHWSVYFCFFLFSCYFNLSLEITMLRLIKKMSDNIHQKIFLSDYRFVMFSSWIITYISYATVQYYHRKKIY